MDVTSTYCTLGYIRHRLFLSIPCACLFHDNNLLHWDDSVREPSGPSLKLQLPLNPSVNGYLAIGSDGHCRVLPRELRRLKSEEACRGMKCKVPLRLHAWDGREHYMKCPSSHFITT